MSKTSITIELDSKVKSALEKRAKRDMEELDDLISDILRRSVISSKKLSGESDKIDDKFLSYFSRRQKVDYIKGWGKKLKNGFK